ncbi:hypothetical protein J437_LFUL002924 [Ladona fulva]|uniref:Nudix hydrolase domain-containing protein n=1 Tax=Ladona fulva TaxID=123851 RepID=A0A8K0KEJ8_LADFU|nr:hypothetical protein J437_LFUL002924 [Ladona fulva]
MTFRFYFRIGVAPNTVQQRKIYEMSQEDSRIFKGSVDRYNGITVSSQKEPCSSADFPIVLSESMNRWKTNNVRGVWFKVFLKHADWVPILAQNGFTFHHAKQEYVMMCKWLPTNGDVCNIPYYAHTMVGVGAVVINNLEEILVVREKYYKNPHWKLPGGYVEPGEDIVNAAMREVKEETAIETKFHSIIAFRHTHGIQFGCSDIYFIVSLAPLSQNIVKCDREIVACQWMKVQDFVCHPEVIETNKNFVKTFLDYRSSGIQITCERNKHPVLGRNQCIFNATLTVDEKDSPVTENDKPQKTDREVSSS